MKIFKITSQPTTTIFKELKQIKSNPALKNLEFKQGQIGDCALLSAIYAMENNNIGKKCLALVTQNAKKGEFNFGTFCKITVDSFQFENKQVKATDPAQEKLLRQLENVYDHLESLKQNSPLGPDHFFSKYREPLEDIQKGVDFSQVCKTFMGFLGIGKEIHIEDSKTQISDMLEKAQTKPKKYILELSAKSTTKPIMSERSKIKVDSNELLMLRLMEENRLLKIIKIIPAKINKNKDKSYLIEIERTLSNKTKDGFIRHHSYAVSKIDNDTVTLINPHNTKKQLIVPKQKIIDNFDTLQGYKISIPEISTTLLKFKEKPINYQAKAFIHKINLEKPVTQADLDLFFKNYAILNESCDGTVSIDNFKKISKIIQSNPSETNIEELINIADHTFAPKEKGQADICQTIFDIITKHPTKNNISSFRSMLYGENVSDYPKIVEEYEAKIYDLTKKLKFKIKNK